MPHPLQATAAPTFYSYHPQASDDLNLESLRDAVRFTEETARESQNNLRRSAGRTEDLPRNLPVLHPSHAVFVASIETTALKAALAALFEQSLSSALHGLDARPVTNAEQYLDETMAMVSQFGQRLKEELRAAAAAKRMSHFRPKPAAGSARAAADPLAAQPMPPLLSASPLDKAGAMHSH